MIKQYGKGEGFPYKNRKVKMQMQPHIYEINENFLNIIEFSK